MLANIVKDENHEKLWHPPVPNNVFNFLAYGALASEGIVKARNSAERLKCTISSVSSEGISGGDMAQQGLASELDKANAGLSGAITAFEGIKHFFGVDWQVSKLSQDLSRVTLYTPTGRHCKTIRGNMQEAFGRLESAWPAVERYILSRTANPAVLYKSL